MKLNGNGNGGGRKYTQSKFIKGKRTCPVCGKTGSWDCNVREDGKLAYCKYVQNESGEKDTLGKYKHILNSDSKSKLTAPKETVIDTSIEAVKADADRLDKVYSALLENLELKPTHKKNLEERGLDFEQICLKMYNSHLGYQMTEIVHNLSKRINLEGVPGFYLKGEIWALNMNYSGFYIPYRDEQGRIVGLQIRRDENLDDKYMWVSSSEKEKGASSGSPLHFVNTETVKETKILYLTEGALKADIIGSLLNVGLVASAGIGAMNPEKLFDSVLEVYPDLERIVLAYDMDWETNENVRMALTRLLETLKEKDVEVDVATWDRSLGKGLDDVLIIENFIEDVIRYVPAAEFQEILDSVVVEEAIEEFPEELVINESSEDKHWQEDFEETSVIVDEQVEVKTDYLGLNWREFSEAEFPNPEKMIFGLGRGNLGLLVASTNVGKTTLILNLALSATSDRNFYPLLTEDHKVKRVMYIDGEATKADLQADLKTMLTDFSFEENESVKDNLHLVCEVEINDESLDLVKPEHLKAITNEALAFKPDLIVVDTLAALMIVEDENDNALMNKEVMQPLRKLARKTNSAVLLLHHSGKYNEGSSQAIDVHKGRGASTLGSLSRTIFNLKEVGGKVVLSCSKAKGQKFEPVALELNTSSRWFEIVNGVSAVSLTKAEQDYWKVVDFVKGENRQVKREEIDNKFTPNEEMSVAKIGKILKKAVENKDLDKKYGYYFNPDYIDTVDNDDTQYCRISTAVASNNMVYINPNQELAMKD